MLPFNRIRSISRRLHTKKSPPKKKIRTLKQRNQLRKLAKGDESKALKERILPRGDLAISAKNTQKISQRNAPFPRDGSRNTKKNKIKFLAPQIEIKPQNCLITKKKEQKIKSSIKTNEKERRGERYRGGRKGGDLRIGFGSGGEEEK